MTGRPLERWEGRRVAAWADAWGVAEVEAWATVASTNDRLLERARTGAPSWSVTLADEQTRGRGRRGATWRSAPGTGLLMSVLVRDVPVDGPLPLVVGVACAEAVESVAPELAVGLKWPNDLLVAGRKVGGILCEGAHGGFVIGIGINVARAPESLVDPSGVQGPRADAPDRDGPPPLPATALEVEADKALSRSDLAGAVLGRLRAALSTAAPFAAARGELERRDVLRGRRVETEEAGTGRASGIAASGALILTRDDGTRVHVVSGGVRLTSESE